MGILIDIYELYTSDDKEQDPYDEKDYRFKNPIAKENFKRTPYYFIDKALKIDGGEQCTQRGIE